MGYGSAKQVARTRAFGFYEQICKIKPDNDKDFWQNGGSLRHLFACIFATTHRLISLILPARYLPPTFQLWVAITNLHIWLLTTWLRALPAEHDWHYHQALIDHFFSTSRTASAPSSNRPAPRPRHTHSPRPSTSTPTRLRRTRSVVSCQAVSSRAR